VDLVFAVLSHLPKGAICELRNRRLIAEAADVKHKLAGKIFWQRVWVWVLSLPIIGVAAFKVAGFVVGQSIQGTGFNGVSLAILISYALVAAIHLLVTGSVVFAGLHGAWEWMNRLTFDRLVGSDDLEQSD